MYYNSTNKADLNTCQMDSALWDRFSNADSQAEYSRNWLAIQCSLISNAIQGVLLINDTENGSFTPVARWPEDGEDPERLVEVSERVLEECCGLLVELDMAGSQSAAISSSYGVAYPILVDDQLRGVVAVEVLARSEDELKLLMGQLQWGISWIELLFRRQQAKEDDASLTRLKSAVDILAGALSEKDADGASMSFVTEMATQLQCDRVSLAFIRNKHARIQAISHSANVGKRMNLIRAIGLAVDEAIIQRKEIIYPLLPDSEVLIVRDHEQLAEQHGSGSILTMPVYGDGRYYGALTLERPSGQPFIKEEVNFCRSVTSLLFPVLETMRQNNRLLIRKIWDSLKDQLIKLVGPRYLGRKLAVILIAVVVVFFYLKTGDYKISADTVLEGAVKRAIVAPFDGYVKEAQVRAGDLVEDGKVMCTLDDRDLRLERLNWLSKKVQYQRQNQEAVAKHNRAEAKIIEAQLAQASARLELVERQLERTLIEAPFNGIVISGDLSQRLGGSVEKGEILFEVSPMDAYRIILEVDERRIADVRVGQEGHMILSALPNEKFKFGITKITPISIPKEGLNFFRVEALPENISGRIRPGMEGIGKIQVDRRNLFSVWTRDLREWLRLWIWSWWR